MPNGDSSDFYQIPFMIEDKNSFDDSQKSEINETMKFVILKEWKGKKTPVMNFEVGFCIY